MNSRIIKSLLKQNAVYWANPVPDGSGGYTYDAPVEIKVRWQDKGVKYINHNAEEAISRAIVLADRSVEIKGMLSLMSLIDLSSSEEPEDNDALEIQGISATPDFKGTSFVRIAYL